MMWIKLIFGGLGRRSVEAIAAVIILAATSATVAASLMVVEGARNALVRAIHRTGPISSKSRAVSTAPYSKLRGADICRRLRYRFTSR